MKLRFQFALTLALALITTTASLLPAAEEVIDGRWKWSSEIGGNTINSVLTLKSDGKKLTGRYKDENIDTEIKNGKVEGETVLFDITFDYEGSPIKVAFDGAIKGDKIDGDVEIIVDGNEEGSYDWNPTRLVEAEDVVGTWKFVYTAPDGIEYTPMLKLTKSGDKLTGKISNDDDDRAVQNLKVSNNKLTFNYTADYQGSDLLLKYTCMPRGDKIEGTLEYDMDGNTGEFDIMATRESTKQSDAVAGKWQLEFTTPEGNTQKPTLEIMTEGDKLKGKLAGVIGGTPFEKAIEDIKLDGDKLTFPVTVTHNGDDIKLTGKFTISGNQLKGTMAYDVNGDTGEMPVTGSRSN